MSYQESGEDPVDVDKLEIILEILWSFFFTLI